MGKGWSILFGLVFLGCLGSFIAAPFISGWWLPKNIASFGGEVDYLFYVILGFTGFFFVLTEVILVYTMWRLCLRAGPQVRIHPRQPPPGNDVDPGAGRHPAVYRVRPDQDLGSHQVLGHDARCFGATETKGLVIAQVTARQWEWRIRLPAEPLPPGTYRDWAEYPESDDVHLVNELHTYLNANVKIYLKTQDVIHSFFLPNLRLKQDALPGKTIPMWFKATQANMVKQGSEWYHDEKLNFAEGEPTFEIACAELCGSRHYAMRGRLCVHPSREDYKAWLNTNSNCRRATSQSRPLPCPWCRFKTDKGFQVILGP